MYIGQRFSASEHDSQEVTGSDSLPHYSAVKVRGVLLIVRSTHQSAWSVIARLLLLCLVHLHLHFIGSRKKLCDNTNPHLSCLHLHNTSRTMDLNGTGSSSISTSGTAAIAKMIISVDQWGVIHAPHAQARALLAEHGCR